MLPLSSDAPVPPNKPTRVARRPVNGALTVDRLMISAAGTENGAADWVINDIEVDGRSQLRQKNLTGALFDGKGVAAAKRAFSSLTFHGFEPVERDRELALVVTYVGPNPDGCPLFASVIGERPPQRPTVVPIVSGVPVLPPSMPSSFPTMIVGGIPVSPAGSGDALPATTITARVENAPFQVGLIEIDDGWDWIVQDLRVDGRSQFKQKTGGIPGDMFAIDAIDTFVTLETCPAGGTIEIDVTYIGTEERGRPFTARLEGTVVREDDSVRPPDLRVVVEAAGQRTAVIGTCDWREPATSNSAP